MPSIVSCVGLRGQVQSPINEDFMSFVHISSS
jgi:hypothetical protein